MTGEHGSMRHLGNAFALDRDDPQLVNMEEGANRSHLPLSVTSNSHLGATSDIVALMVLEHQTRLHNLITRANYEAREAAHLDRSMNEALGRPMDHVSESTQRRIASVCDALLSGLLFSDELELTSTIKGSSGFAESFSSRGPFDSKGRSLYQLDLKQHLFQLPCSYMILSAHFDGLPDSVMKCIQSELHAILSKQIPPPKGSWLNEADCIAIREVLNDLKPGWLGSSLELENP